MKFDGEIIKRLREDLELSVMEFVIKLHDKAGYSTSPQNVYGWESGQEPKGDALIALSKLFNKDIKYFYKED